MDAPCQCLVVINRVRKVCTGGSCRQLDEIPQPLPGVIVVEIDYRPEFGVMQVMPYACGWRDLYPDEIKAINNYLEHFHARTD